MNKSRQNITVVKGGKYNVGKRTTQKSKYRFAFSITRPHEGEKMTEQNSTKGKWFLSCSGELPHGVRFALIKLTDDGPLMEPIEDFMIGIPGFDEKVEEGYFNCDKKEFKDLFLSYLLALSEQNTEKVDDILSRCVSVWKACEEESYAGPAAKLLKRLAP
jgi:hypothetical protein